ncbi:hypothetical protein V8C86DRAFT_97690 [Haematococcus lacustris]
MADASAQEKRVLAILAEQEHVMQNPNHVIDKALLHMRLLTYKWRHADRTRASTTMARGRGSKRKASPPDDSELGSSDDCEAPAASTPPPASQLLASISNSRGTSLTGRVGDCPLPGSLHRGGGAGGQPLGGGAGGQPGGPPATQPAVAWLDPLQKGSQQPQQPSQHQAWQQKQQGQEQPLKRQQAQPLKRQQDCSVCWHGNILAQKASQSSIAPNP